MSKWEPIETAPKDGTRVLLWRPYSTGDGSVSVGFWSDDRYRQKPSPYWADVVSLGKSFDRHRPPSHWMPLPAPPEPSVEVEG